MDPKAAVRATRYLSAPSLSSVLACLLFSSGIAIWVDQSRSSPLRMLWADTRLYATHKSGDSTSLRTTMMESPPKRTAALDDLRTSQRRRFRSALLVDLVAALEVELLKSVQSLSLERQRQREREREREERGKGTVALSTQSANIKRERERERAESRREAEAPLIYAPGRLRLRTMVDSR